MGLNPSVEDARHLSRNVEIPDTRPTDRHFHNAKLFCLQSVAAASVVRVFGRRSALLPAVEAGQGLEERRNMTIDTGR